MNIWLVQIGEPVPTEKRRDERLMRNALLAEELSSRGHNVTWWASTFDHVRKEYRYTKETTLQVKDNYRIVLLHCKIQYRKNVSLLRLLHQKQISKIYSDKITEEDTPDLIFCGMPTPELALYSALYAVKSKVKCILDIRDLWPDDLIQLAPKFLRILAYSLLLPMQKAVKRACSLADGLCATSPHLMKWGLNHANRQKGKFDSFFPLAYVVAKPVENELISARTFWDSLNVKVGQNELIVCYIGTLGRQVILEPIIDAAKRLLNDQVSAKFVICGQGEALNKYKNYMESISNIVLAGWVNKSQLNELMARAHVGLISYPVKESFLSNFPNKSIEYLSSGLVVGSTIKGILGNAIQTYKIGFTFDSDNGMELYEQLKYLKDNPLILEEMKKNSKEYFDNNFDGTKIYSEMADKLEYIVKN